MAKYKDEISNKHDGDIIWERLDNKKASCIKYEMSETKVKQLEGKFSDELYWNDLIKWYSKAMVDFYNVLYPYWVKAQKDIN